jgi:adenylate cyclase
MESEASAIDTAADEAWRAILMGEAPGLQRIRRSVGWIPAEPRCKLCAAPIGPPGNIFLRPFGFGPSRLNRRLCKKCFHQVGDSPGGAEVEISMMFADVRGSTSLAERMPPQEFSRLVSRFYGTAARVVDRTDGIVDKFVGDEVVALYIPGFAGSGHAGKAIEAARQLLHETGNAGGDPWIPVGGACTPAWPTWAAWARVMRATSPRSATRPTRPHASRRRPPRARSSSAPPPGGPPDSTRWASSPAR